MNLLASLILLVVGGFLMFVGGHASGRSHRREAKILLGLGGLLLAVSAMVR